MTDDAYLYTHTRLNGPLVREGIDVCVLQHRILRCEARCLWCARLWNRSSTTQPPLEMLAAVGVTGLGAPIAGTSACGYRAARSPVIHQCTRALTQSPTGSLGISSTIRTTSQGGDT